MGFLSKLFGKKPKVPAFVKIDLDEQMRKSVSGNRAIVGDAGKLALEQQAADQAALEQGLKSSIRGYEGLVTGEREVIGDMLAGTVSDDVWDEIRRRNPNIQQSQGGEFNRLRNLGLTSMQQQEKGLVAAERFKTWHVGYGMAKPMSVTSMFTSPQERLAHESSERSMKFQRDWLQAKTDAAPDPRFVGVAKVAASALGGVWGQALGAGLGMDMQQGGGGGGGGYNVQNNIAAMDRITAQNQGGFLQQSFAPNPWNAPAANIGGGAGGGLGFLQQAQLQHLESGPFGANPTRF
jgi:hypothetical protein